MFHEDLVNVVRIHNLLCSYFVIKFSLFILLIMELFVIHNGSTTPMAEVCRGYGGFGALGHSVYTRELLPRLVNGSWSGKISHLATSGTHTAAVSEQGWCISQFSIENICIL